jgi:hypothetical protein
VLSRALDAVMTQKSSKMQSTGSSALKKDQGSSPLKMGEEQALPPCPTDINLTTTEDLFSSNERQAKLKKIRSGKS